MVLGQFIVCKIDCRKAASFEPFGEEQALGVATDGDANEDVRGITPVQTVVELGDIASYNFV